MEGDDELLRGLGVTARGERDVARDVIRDAAVAAAAREAAAREAEEKEKLEKAQEEAMNTLANIRGVMRGNIANIVGESEAAAAAAY